MLQDEQTLRRTVAKNIAAYRKSHKDTQLDLARKLNYSDKSVSKWERGEGLPDVYILAQIAQLYGVTVSNLIGEEEPPKKANPHFHIYVLLLSVALVFVLLLAILGGTAWGVHTWLHTTAYLGNDNGKVAVYSGVPADVFGVPLHSQVETTDVNVSDLQPGTAARLQDGIRVDTLDAANDLVQQYRDEAAQHNKAEG